MDTKKSPQNEPSKAGERAQQDRFIAVGGIDVLISDFVRIWNGEEILPALSDEDHRYISRLKQTDPNELFSEDASTLVFHNLGTHTDTMFQEHKFKKLQGIIRDFKRSDEGRELRMDRVLAALSERDIRFNTVREFVARCGEPTAQWAAVLNETTQGSTWQAPESRYIDRSSAQALPKESEQRVAALLKELPSKIPGVLLERALFEHQLHDDDYRDLSVIKNIGNDKIVKIMQITRYALLLGGMGIAIYGMSPLVLQRGHEEEARQLVSSGMIAALTGTVLHFFPTEALRTASKLSSSKARYKKIFDELSKQVAALKKNYLGRAKLVLLQQIVLASYQEAADQGAIDELWNFIQHLEASPDEQRIFEESCRSSSASVFLTDFNTLPKVMNEVNAFKRLHVDEKVFLETLPTADANTTRKKVR